MDLISLHYFVVTAEECHVTRAAKKLFISQQTLSEHIKRLEKHLGTRLFERRPVFRLTPDGEAVLQYAKQLVELEKKMISSLSDINHNVSAKIVIGLSRNRARLFFPSAWREFRIKYPNIDVEIIEESATALYEMLITGRIDIYIGLELFEDERTINYTLSYENFFFIINRKMFLQYYGQDTPEAISSFHTNMDIRQLKQMPLLMFRQGNHFRNILDQAFSQMHYKPQIIFESNDHEMIYSLCRSGLGAGFISEFYLRHVLSLEPHHSDIYAFPLQDSRFITKVILATRSNYHISHYARDFFSIIRSHYTSPTIPL